MDQNEIDRLGYGIALASAKRVMQSTETIKSLRANLADKQATIDRLMLEYCPEEVTPEQLAEYARHQQAYIPAEAKLASAEPVATLLNPNPYDERIGFYLSLDDRKRLSELPTGTRLFTEAQPAPDVQAAVEAALEKAVDVVLSYQDRTGLDQSSIIDGIRAIPRDTSALDEYKADIKRLLDALGEIVKTDDEAYAALVLELGDDAKLLDTSLTEKSRKLLSELKAKYNLL